MPRLDPWERQSGEGEEPYQAFVKYRDQGLTRGLHKVARELGKSAAIVARWSSRWSWVERCEAWDREQDRLWRLERHKAIRDMARRHVAIAGAMQTKVVERLRTMDPKSLKARELAQFMEAAARLERLALGEPDTRVAVAQAGPGPDLDGLTDEERQARLETLAREVAGRLARQERPTSGEGLLPEGGG